MVHGIIRTRFTIKHHAFRRSDSDFFVQLRMGEREFHSFFNLLDLRRNNQFRGV